MNNKKSIYPKRASLIKTNFRNGNNKGYFSPKEKCKHRCARHCVGGKTKLNYTLINYLPLKIQKMVFFDAFAGGGSVSILASQLCERVISNDIDSNVINVYNTIKNSPQEFGTYCNEKIKNENKETLQNRYKLLDDTNTLENIYNSYCVFSTAYGGKITTPSNNKVLKFKKIDHVLHMESFQSYFNKIEFTNKDYKETLERARNTKNAFVFLDPPYFTVSGYYGKDGVYHKNFNHQELKNEIDKISKYCPIMLTYDDCPEIRELYKDYRIRRIKNISSKKNNKTGRAERHETWELIITNY